MPKNLRPSGNNARDIKDLFDEINALSNAVNQKEQFKTSKYYEGKSGDLRVETDADGYSYIRAWGDNKVYTTFRGVLQELTKGIPHPYFPSLYVDNFFARTFLINQTQAFNGNYLMSDTAVVEAVYQTGIRFKDPTNLNLCPFVADDICEVRQVKMDKSLDIRLSQFTVDSVSGRTVQVTYEGGSDPVKVGDVVVRIGNASDTDRQNSIWFYSNGSTAPRISLYSGVDSTTLPSLPDVAIGLLDGLTSPVHGALTGMGAYFQDNLYADNVYLSGSISISNPGDINTSDLNNDAGWTDDTTADSAYSLANSKPLTFYQASAPSTSSPEGSIWFDSDSLNDIYRLESSTWNKKVGIGSGIGTYIDASGVYTSTVAANQVVAGTLTGFTINTVADSNAGQIKLYQDGTVGRIRFSNSSGFTIGDIYGYTDGSSNDWIGFTPNVKVPTLDATSNLTISGASVATQAWVSSALSLYATQSWVGSQGYITGNQTITLSGDVTGSGATAITTTVANDSHNHTGSTVTGLTTSNFTAQTVSQWTNDSGYITGNQSITLSGDASGSGTTAITVTVADDSHSHSDTTLSSIAASKVSGAWGSTSGYVYVASSSGGSPVVACAVLNVSIGGTTHQLLADPT